MTKATTEDSTTKWTIPKSETTTNCKRNTRTTKATLSNIRNSMANKTKLPKDGFVCFKILYHMDFYLILLLIYKLKPSEGYNGKNDIRFKVWSL